MEERLAPADQRVLPPVVPRRPIADPLDDAGERSRQELPRHPHGHHHGRDQQPVADDLSDRELLADPTQDLRELQPDEDEEDRLEG